MNCLFLQQAKADQFAQRFAHLPLVQFQRRAHYLLAKRSQRQQPCHAQYFTCRLTHLGQAVLKQNAYALFPMLTMAQGGYRRGFQPLQVLGSGFLVGAQVMSHQLHR